MDYIENELPMGFGWSLVSYYIETDGWLNFCGVKRMGDGYIKQEVNKLREQYYDAKRRNEINGK